MEFVDNRRLALITQISMSCGKCWKGAVLGHMQVHNRGCGLIPDSREVFPGPGTMELRTEG